ncbi:hypothetical protein H8959_004078 [Pygathrix nigripes]
MFLAYRVCMTNEGHPWVSLVVQKTRLQISQDPSLNYEYLPTMGLKSFIQASLELLFGKHSQAIVENRVRRRALPWLILTKRGGLWLVRGGGGVCVPTELHGLVFQDMGFTVCEYSIWDPKKLCVDPNILLNVVEQIPHGCVLVIGNIIDCKLTPSGWAKLVSMIKSKQIFPFFDIPCQGLYTGDLEEDTRILQYFVSQGFEFFCSQSLSKNFGIYDEGVGILVVVAVNNQQLLGVLSQLKGLAEALWLNPPNTGARIITSILCNPALLAEWKQSLKEVVENIMLTKEKVKEKLRLLGTPGSWGHITEQSGTHGYLGLNLKKHIYIPKNSQINFSCINANNINYITEGINEAVLLTEGSEICLPKEKKL